MIEIEKLKQLSVRILDTNNIPYGSGGIYVADNGKAYVLTAAHVIHKLKKEKIEDLNIECWSNNEEQRIVTVKTETAIMPQKKESTTKWYAEDVAIIPLEMTGELQWMNDLPKAKLAVPDGEVELSLAYRKVRGIGYSGVDKSATPTALSHFTTVYGEDSCCLAHTMWDHLMTCYLDFHTGVANDDREMGGMSGSILALTDPDEIVLVGMATVIMDDYALKKYRCVDLFYIKEMLVQQRATPRMAGIEELQQGDSGRVRWFGTSCPRQSYKLVASRQKELQNLNQIIDEYPVVNIWGTPGIGRSSVAMALGQTLHLKEVHYLKFKDPGAEEDQLRPTVDEITGRLKEKTSDMVVVIDDFKLNDGGWDELWNKTSLNSVPNLKLVLVSSCAIDGVKNYHINAPVAEVFWEKYQRKIAGKIKKEDFDEIVKLVGMHPEIIAWIAKYFEELGGNPGADRIKRIKEDIRSGSFQEMKLLIKEEMRSIRELLDEKFPLKGEHKKTVRLLSYIPESGIDNELLKPVNFDKVQHQTERNISICECKKNGWVVEVDDKITIPTILRLLFIDEANQEACEFYESIWNGCALVILNDQQKAKEFAEIFELVRNHCPSKGSCKHDNCKRDRCWTYLPEAGLWLSAHEYEKAKLVLESFRKQLEKSDRIPDAYYREVLSHILEKNSGERLMRAGASVLDNLSVIDVISPTAVHYNLGTLYKGDKVYAKAIKEFKQASDCAQNAKRKLLCYGNLADIFKEQNKMSEFHEYTEKVRKLYDEIEDIDKADPYVGVYYSDACYDQADVEKDRGNLGDAKELFQNAFDSRKITKLEHYYFFMRCKIRLAQLSTGEESVRHADDAIAFIDYLLDSANGEERVLLEKQRAEMEIIRNQ